MIHVPRAGCGPVLVEPAPPLLQPPQDGRAGRAVRERVHRIRERLRDYADDAARFRRDLKGIIFIQL